MQELIDFIISCFTEEELELLKDRNAHGEIWTFREQIETRFSSKYPSFAPLEELKNHVKKRVNEYKLLFHEETLKISKELLLDRLEKEIFISYPTYLWNKEMFNNIDTKPIDYKVPQAVEQIISSINPGLLKTLTLEVNGRVYDLKTLLLSRWSKGWVVGNEKIFEENFAEDLIYNPYSIHFLNTQDSINKWELQACLENIDLYFIYPDKFFVYKENTNIDDCRISSGGWRNRERFLSATSSLDLPFKIISKLIIVIIVCLIFIGFQWLKGLIW